MSDLRGLFISIDDVEAVDGDTIKFSSQFRDKEYRVRIVDLWCPETTGEHAALGMLAKSHLNRFIASAEHVQLFLPYSEVGFGFSLLDLVSFNRLTCHVLLDGVKVSDMMVNFGCGYQTKQEQIDAGVYGR